MATDSRNQPKPDSIGAQNLQHLTDRVQAKRGGEYIRPKPAATMILLDQSGSEPTVLMGRRNAKVRFMPGMFVFPGGRLDPSDRQMNIAGPLHEVVEHKLDQMRGARKPRMARALALAAIRETFEETGILLGTKDFGAPENPPPGPWSEFAAHGVFPDLESIQFIARAITPPARPRRFDATFLAMDVASIAHQVDGVVGPDAELVEMVRVPLSEALKLPLPDMQIVVLRELRARLDAGMGHFLPVPMYRELNRKWVRLEI